MIDNTKRKGPIGIFDSGVGGLTVFSEIAKLLPKYDYIYLGDNARTPYGNRSFETIYRYTLEAVEYLFDLGCPLIILACNTASAKALKTIQVYNLPNIREDGRVLGIIKPTVERLSEETRTNHVGILSTIGTVKSESYQMELTKLNTEITLYQEACPMWVPLVESGELNNEGTEFFVRQNINNLLSMSDKIDTILLGCTHYPLLMKSIVKFVPPHIKILTQGSIVANSLKNYLKRHPEIEINCTKKGTQTFLTTDDTALFDQKAVQFYNTPSKSEFVIISF